ncbi:uncharacterized protein (DUF305 family) [Marisediminicola sp. UYEF4]|uniref:DUF305 domain-containing protein n=1 Tax=Marisediminicola sp. UYEF4 TaxID=1756384 RepID=UPI003391A557
MIVAIVASGVLLLGGFAIGRLVMPADQTTPSTTSAEAGFARDMQTHHQQAVEMAIIVRDTTDNQDIKTLAYDIATSQGQQAGQMFAWLRMWGLPQAASDPAMTWMAQPTLDSESGDSDSTTMPGMTMPGTTMPAAAMPGLATPQQIAALQTATGADADKMFLELMIAHHTGGVEMAQALLERSTNDIVTALAGNIVRTQNSEMDYMNQLLAAY